ncbi:MAG: ArsR family transcriptional regulator [Sporolactobacillus sp.]
MSPKKVSRILLTEGIDLNNSMTKKVKKLKDKECSTSQIADILKISRTAVLTHLPYSKGDHIQDGRLMNKSLPLTEVTPSRTEIAMKVPLHEQSIHLQGRRKILL